MTEPRSAPPKRRLWLKILFGVSLALNLLVVGVIAGAALRFGGEHGPKARGGGPPNGLSILRALDREDRHRILRAARAQTAEPRFDRRAHQAALIDALRRSPFDPGELDGLIARQQADAQARLGAVSGAWRAHIVELSDADRRAYADRLETISARYRKSPKDAQD